MQRNPVLACIKAGLDDTQPRTDYYDERATRTSTRARYAPCLTPNGEIMAKYNGSKSRTGLGWDLFPLHYHHVVLAELVLTESE